MRREKVEEIYHEYRLRELDSVNEMVADTLIAKFDDLMKSNNLIRQDSMLGRKLQDKKLFKRDVKCVIGYVTPILPFIGLIEGIFVTLGEMVDNYAAQDNMENKNDGDENNSSETQEGNQQSETTEDTT